MPKLYDAQRMVLEAILDDQGKSSAFIEETRVAQVTQTPLRDIRDWLLTLDQDEYADLPLTDGGLKASVTPKGRLALGLYRPFPTQPVPSLTEPARSRNRSGRERALVIGIGDYPPPSRKLPAGAFIACDTTTQGIAVNAVPLRRIRATFDASLSQRAFLRLDFCHSGGIIARDHGAEHDDREVIGRALEVVQGQGKLVIAACTSS